MAGFLLVAVTTFVLGFVAASTPGTGLVGRFTAKGEAEWSLSEIRLTVERTTAESPLQLAFDCSSNCLYYIDIVANCGEFSTTNTVAISPSTSAIDVDSLLGPSFNSLRKIELQVIKVTETNTESAVRGAMLLTGVIGGKVIENAEGGCLSKPKAHKMLVFGDSITCGYGVLGKDPCPFTGATESARLAWANLVAQQLDAEINIVAWSGKGMVRNYGEKTTTSPQPLPAYYNATLGEQMNEPGNEWDPSRYQPNLVAVYLGANDYSTDPHPTDDEFVGAYLAFVARIKADYPAAKLLLLSDNFSGSSNGNIKVANVQAVASQSGSAFFLFPSTLHVLPTGCNGHPSTQQQKGMADSLLPEAARLLGV